MAATDSGSIALTVAAVPTGMKAGVRISPRGVRITPVRAAPSRASAENENALAIRRLITPSAAGCKAPANGPGFFFTQIPESGRATKNAGAYLATARINCARAGGIAPISSPVNTCSVFRWRSTTA